MHIIQYPEVRVNHYVRSHFAPAFLALAPHRRRALKVLYAVCRLLDDVVDTENPQAAEILRKWREVITSGNLKILTNEREEQLAAEFVSVIEKFEVPRFALTDLIDKGVSTDLQPRRYETAMDLESYCYGVAGTVGLACLPIFGVPWPEAKEFAIRLGVSIQWINTIRDVGSDRNLGRLYLPLDHLERFGYTERDLEQGVNNDAFQKLMSYEASVARSHYDRAMELLPPTWEKELRPAKIMGRIYINLLEKIEKLRFPIFEKRVSLKLWEKGVAMWQATRD